MIKDSNTRLNEYQAGSIDVIELTGDQVQDLQKEDQYKDLIKEFDDGSNFYLQYNVTRPGLNNANIRKAITYAVITLLNLFFFFTTDTKTIFAMVFLILAVVFFTERISSKWMENQWI